MERVAGVLGMVREGLEGGEDVHQQHRSPLPADFLLTVHRRTRVVPSGRRRTLEGAGGEERGNQQGRAHQHPVDGLGKPTLGITHGTP